MEGHAKIAQQSRKWIRSSLLDLMKSEPYEKISVTNIAVNADLSRRTFYRLFIDKNAVLSSIAETLIDNYFDRLKKMEIENMSFSAVMTSFFEYWWENKATIQILIDQNMFIATFSKVSGGSQNTKMYELFQVPWHISGSKKAKKYVMTFFTGGYWNIVNTWLQDDKPESPAEIAKILTTALEKLSQPAN